MARKRRKERRKKKENELLRVWEKERRKEKLTAVGKSGRGAYSKREENHSENEKSKV